jgi:hypothetical protein
VNYRLSTATLIVSTKSITAFWGDLKYLQMPEGDVTDLAGRAVETASMNPVVAIEVGREFIPGIYNAAARNGDFVSSSRLIKR